MLDSPLGDAATVEDWVPGPVEIADYWRNGFLISPAIVPDALLEAAWSSIEHFMAGRRERAIAPRAAASDRRVADGEPLEQLGYLALQTDAVRALARHVPIARAAAALAGSDVIRLFHDRTIVKPPKCGGDAAVGWHTDRSYWRTCSSDRLLTAWIPFQDVDLSTGALMVVEGSHRWQGTDRFPTGHRTDLDALEREIGACGPDFRPVPMAMKKGQISFHHCRAVHGSLPNRGDLPRAAIAIHLQPGDNRYRPAWDEDGRPTGHTNDILCRRTVDGMPDYADPNIFPTLWPATG